MGIMQGKRGLVTGVLHETSIATGIAQSLLREGAECLYSHMPGEKMERRTRRIVEGLGVATPWLHPMDVSSDADVAACFERIGRDFGQIDFFVHSIAFADKDWLRLGRFAAVGRPFVAAWQTRGEGSVEVCVAFLTTLHFDEQDAALHERNHARVVAARDGLTALARRRGGRLMAPTTLARA